MQRLAGSSLLEGVLVDWVVTRPAAEPRLPVPFLSAQEKAAELQRIQAERAKLSAREAEVMLGFAADRPDEQDPQPGTPGARSTEWRQTDPDFPGVSESFPDELGMVLGVARGTAAHRLRRAWTWRHSLPRTEAAQRRGELDERRAQIFADTLQHARADLAGPVEEIVLPEAAGLSFSALKKRLLAVLLELDPDWADRNRRIAERNSDVWVEPGDDGRATIGAELNAEEAAEGSDFINTLAVMAKQDGDPRPIGQIRTEIYSLLIRGAAINAHGARTNLTIVAALEAQEGTSTQPAEVNGYAITPAHLAELLRRVGALGLHTPEDGSLTFALTDTDGKLIATLSLAELQRAVKRGEGANPPAATAAYTPTRKQRELVNTRDRGCRMPFCGQRTGWADHDHVVSHSHGGETTCTNLCCLCRSHHRLKTLFRDWLFAMEPDGTLHVTTPSGVTRATQPWAMRRRPPPPPPETRTATLLDLDEEACRHVGDSACLLVDRYGIGGQAPWGARASGVTTSWPKLKLCASGDTTLAPNGCACRAKVVAVTPAQPCAAFADEVPARHPRMTAAATTDERIAMRCTAPPVDSGYRCSDGPTSISPRTRLETRPRSRHSHAHGSERMTAMTTTRMTRHFAAPRSAVYRALLDRDAVARWKVPANMSSEVHEWDAREGGRLRVSLTYAGNGVGKTSAHTDTYHGRFTELVPDERVVEVDEFESADPELRAPMTITITLTDADDGGTDLAAVHEGLPSSVAPEDNELGWRESLDRLAALVEQG